MIDQFKIRPISNPKRIDVLHRRSSTYLSLHYSYDQEVIDLLKKNFKLDGSLYLIATSEEHFAGFCSIDPDRWEEDFFFLREIFVEPAFQKKRIGCELMERCINHARDLGAKGVVTETTFKNKPMQKLCLSFGFEKWDNPQWKEGITYKLLFS